MMYRTIYLMVLKHGLINTANRQLAVNLILYLAVVVVISFIVLHFVKKKD